MISHIFIAFSLGFCVSIFAEKTEINCSAFLYGENDWSMQSSSSHCIEEVQRVRKYCGGTKINFVLTQFWMDHNGNGIINGFATKRGMNIIPIDESNKKTIINGMTKCFEMAINSGFNTIEITPHLDDGMGRNTWRNTLDMNPLKKYDGKYSYYDIMVQPIAIALNTAVKNTHTVHTYMALQGEMNIMLWKYPSEWLRIATAIKKLLPSGAKTGVSVNFNKLCGDICTPQIVKTFKLLSVSNLLHSIDFLGMSSYPKTSIIPKPKEFENSITILANEFKTLGIDLMLLLHNENIELHFSEFGNGGSSCSNIPTHSPIHVVDCPYYGVIGGYNAQTNPWKTLVMNQFITRYYRQLVKWVAGGTGPIYKVKAIYIWNVASWDVTCIYHSDIDKYGGYRVNGVVNALKNWNDHNIVS